MNTFEATTRGILEATRSRVHSRPFAVNYLMSTSVIKPLAESVAHHPEVVSPDFSEHFLTLTSGQRQAKKPSRKETI